MFPVQTEEGGDWDMVSEDDLWEDENMDPSEQDYVVVKEEDIVDGIACFMAACLRSLKQTKVCCTSCNCLRPKLLRLPGHWCGTYRLASFFCDP